MPDDLTIGLIVFAVIAFYQWIRANFWRHIHRKKITEFETSLERIEQKIRQNNAERFNDSVLDAEEIY